MLLKLRKNLIEGKLGNLGLELIVVIVGILIAFEIDRWALGEFAALTNRVKQSYERYEFHSVYHGLHNFCGTVISSLYMDVLKDRLYCSAPDAPERRAAQTVIHRILDGLLRLMAPVLCFTAAEAWEYFKGQGQNPPIEDSIFFVDFPETDDIVRDPELEGRWARLLAVRSEITRVLEAARRDKQIGLSLDAEVVLQAKGELRDFLAGQIEQLKELCIVSNLRLAGDTEEGIVFTEAEAMDDFLVGVAPAPGGKCERCWTISPSVGESAAHPQLCKRCTDVVESLAG